MLGDFYENTAPKVFKTEVHWEEEEGIEVGWLFQI